jgi:hypothetical protein
MIEEVRNETEYRKWGKKIKLTSKAEPNEDLRKRVNE